MKRLIKLALVIGAVSAASRMIRAKRAEWDGLTESQVRDKIEDRMPQRVPADKRTAVADTVVAKMRSRGRLGHDDPADPDDVSDGNR